MWNKSWRFVGWLLLLAIVGIPVTIFVSRYLVDSESQGRLYSDSNSIPFNEVGLVLGCREKLSDGRGNLFFEYRVTAASNLYKAGKVKFFIVSGDNHREGYDEPSDMKNALVRLGAPVDRIYCDYAGFSTLDSVVRAKAIFGQESLTVISQAFHNKRAIFLGLNRGIDIVGFNANDVSSHTGRSTMLREYLAVVKAVLDIFIFQRDPKFLGSPIAIGTQQVA